jgi:hypothetical protein
MSRDLFTVIGNPEIEQSIGEIAGALENFFCEYSHELDLVLMVGGYGNGEGGVRVVDGELKLKNNIDLLLFPKPLISKKFYLEFKSLLQRLEKKFDILFDFGDMDLSWLKNSKSLMAYDLKEGHKVLFRNNDLATECLFKPFEIDEVEIDEFKALIVNRGILLYMNDALYPIGKNDKVKVHIAKAIVGLGDFVLRMNGLYSWSYTEKLSSILTLKEYYPYLVELYLRAYRYRAYDDQGLFEESSLEKLNMEVKDQYQQILKKFEVVLVGGISKKTPTLAGVFKSLFKYSQYRDYIWSQKRYSQLLLVAPTTGINEEVIRKLISRCLDVAELIPIWASVNDVNYGHHIPGDAA